MSLIAAVVKAGFEAIQRVKDAVDRNKLEDMKYYLEREIIRREDTIEKCVNSEKLKDLKISNLQIERKNNEVTINGLKKKIENLENAQGGVN